MLARESNGVLHRPPAMAVILGGGLKPSPLQELSSVSVLDLPMGHGSTVLAELLSLIEREWPDRPDPLPTRVIWGTPVPAPMSHAASPGLDVRLVQETKQWRGPAGVLKDVCEGLGDDGRILLIEGARWAGAGLGGLFAAMEQTNADAVIGCNADESPAGAYLLRRSALESVSDQGFVDLKEQLLPRLAASGRPVVVHHMPPPGILPVRTLADYLEAVRQSRTAGSGWALIDASAVVDTTALVYESVVMAGAMVGAGAVVARSIVLAGGVVGPGTEVVDTVVLPGQSPRARSGDSERRGVSR